MTESPEQKYKRLYFLQDEARRLSKLDPLLVWAAPLLNAIEKEYQALKKELGEL
jgi:hypothetical protein